MLEIAAVVTMGIIDMTIITIIVVFVLKFNKKFTVITTREKLIPNTRAHEIAERRNTVLELLSQGKREQEIADLMFCSPCTIKRDVRNLKAILKAKTTANLIMRARETGLLKGGDIELKIA